MFCIVWPEHVAYDSPILLKKWSDEQWEKNANERTSRPKWNFRDCLREIPKIIVAWRYCSLYSRKIANTFSSRIQE